MEIVDNHNVIPIEGTGHGEGVTASLSSPQSL